VPATERGTNKKDVTNDTAETVWRAGFFVWFDEKEKITGRERELGQ